MRTIDQGKARLKIFVNVVVVFLALLSFSKRDFIIHQTSFFENFMIDSFAPFQTTITFFRKSIKSLRQNYLTNLAIGEENTLLKRRVEDYKSRLFAFEEISKENKRLKSLLHLVDRIDYKRVLAQVVGKDTTNDFKVVRINKGRKDGIKLQSTVITSDGLVGYIYRTTKHYADVLTILDSNNKVDGIIERIRVHGIVEGAAFNRCIMKYVTRMEPVVLQDKIITSGLGNVYPKGITIGVISKIERESYGVTQKITVAPSVAFEKLEEVIVLISMEESRFKKEREELDRAGEYDG